MSAAIPRPVGEMLREWRERRRLSQLALALDAGVSARHVSFLETGRVRPSREMVLRLAEQLPVPLQHRNALLLAAGFAPPTPKAGLGDPALAVARAAIERVLTGHEPSPAIAADHHWSLVAANRAVGIFLAGVSPRLMQPPVNVLRVSLHPDGLAPRIANLPQWRGRLLAWLGRQVELAADPALSALLAELEQYPVANGGVLETWRHQVGSEIAVPLRLRTEDGTLSFLSTTMIFGTPVDVTLSELAVEAFFPADTFTAEMLPRLVAAVSTQS